MQGIVSDYKRMSVHDGPGIRTTVFLKGCPLRCLWCHNPENLTALPALSYTHKLCVGCGACAAVCPKGVHEFRDGQHLIHHDACIHCGACVAECFPGALRIFGHRAEAETVAAKLLEDRAFYEQSGGGVTFSGGEPLLQPDFLREVMTILKSEGVHVAVDTCGDVAWAAIETVLPLTDLFLFDIKHMDPARHKAGTGHDNARILANLHRLSALGTAVEIRTPVIPGYNDDEETLTAIAEMLSGMPNVLSWRLLPYHSMAKGKYEAIGLHYDMPETEMPGTERMRSLCEALAGIFPGVKLSADV
ncbi:MAG: glycyl-radical enzyme activating protein [Ruminococcaceae bacterium]|nr:glycyl-radical enzyme activating protein [Oscillospiraceae bacterium]